MKVHLIRKETLLEFALKHARSRSSFADWLLKISYADWESPNDITATFGTADLLGNHSNRVVFDLGGNNYRIICKYAFGKKTLHLFVCWLGTHAEYDKLCKSKEQFTVSHY